jgi:predicted hotdog family 3-hydroxylacyl-ACP dehydratase
MAQAISALCGLWMRAIGQEPRVGFIMSVSSMRIGIPMFKIGNRLEIKVREYNSVETVHNFAGDIFLDDRNVIEGKLTVLDVTEEQIEALKKEARSN